MLLTFGSQAADMSVGSMTEAPRPQRGGRSWALWKRLAQGRSEFGNPAAFFGEAHVPNSHWVTFTVTTTGTEFLDQMAALTGSETGRGGLVSLIDSSWLLSLSVFHQPEIIGQPPGSRAAICSTVTAPTTISSSQRRPRAIDATSVARV